MTTPSSGQISILDVVGEFGGSAPHSLSEYYGAGGDLGQAGSAATDRSGTAGAAGKAVDLNGNVATFDVNGTRYGAVA